VTSGSDSSEQGKEMYNKTEIVTNKNNIKRLKPPVESDVRKRNDREHSFNRV
jgi:hypothetical protein